METAVRETEEEAGFKREHLNIVADFRKTLRYNVRNKPKRVEYWLAELKDPNIPVVLSDEHTGYKWLKCDDAKRLAFFPDMQAVIQEADDFINKL